MARKKASASSTQQRVFAIDIGTRSVVGLLGYYEAGMLIVEHGEVEYHKSRVMLDGQVHDIAGVAETLKIMKEKMESYCGYKLTDVAVAAAGRSLITARSELAMDIDPNKPIETHLIETLEMECLQHIYNELLEASHEIKDYFCVGHTVVHYYLNDTMMLNLAGHKGSKIKVDLIATFLPRTVVESLYAVVSSLGLQVRYLTLEPIAAIEVAVPANIRLLNIALVDIGAGTSDIAITKDGAVVAYAMTSTAGDEITEAIAKQFLLDFESAEKLKCSLNHESIHTFTDIIGIEHRVSSEEILDKLHEAIDLVAKNIAKNILEQNGKAPSAVFLTGGGSQIPRLNEVIAGYLELPKERVTTRDAKTIPNVNIRNFAITGPDAITPIGILSKAVAHSGTDFLEVFVNGESVKLINSKALKVSDALVLIGFNPRKLLPESSGFIEVLVNGHKRIVAGEPGEPPQIYVNNRVANLGTRISHKDEIVILPAKPGKSDGFTIGNLLNVHEGFYLNETWTPIFSNIQINRAAADEASSIVGNDTIEFEQLKTIEEVCEKFNIPSIDAVRVNGHPAEASYRIHDRDRLVFDADSYEEMSTAAKPLPAIVAETERMEQQQPIAQLAESAASVEKADGREPALVRLTYNDAPFFIPFKENLLFVHVFDYIDFDRSRVQGTLLMQHNGENANLSDPVREGDHIVVKWV